MGVSLFSFHAFMAAGGWAVYAFITMLFSAGVWLGNQYFQKQGALVVFWMRVFVVVMMTPFMLTIKMPTSPLFYGAVFLTSFIGAFADMRTFDTAAKYGGGVVSRTMPLFALFAFFLWFVVDPSLLFEYLKHPLRAMGIVVSVLGVIYFAMRLRKCDVTQGAWRMMLPALIGYTFGTILNKKAMAFGGLGSGADITFEGAVYGYIYVQSALAVLILGPYITWRQHKKIANGETYAPLKPIFISGVVIGTMWMASMIFKNYAMAYTPHPVYVDAIRLTAPVMIAVFYFFMKHKETADVKPSMGIVFCAIVMTLLAI